MQASIESTTPWHTRAANATKHPRKPDAPAKWRTPMQKQANEAHLLDIESMEHANTLLTLANVASVEDAMEITQTAKRAMAPKAICPSTKKPVKDSVSAAKVPANAKEVNSTTTQSISAGQDTKSTSGSRMQDLLAAGQAHRLQAKQLVAAAAKIHGMAQPHVDGCDLEHIWPESTDTGHDHKNKVLTKVKHWTVHVKKEQATSNHCDYHSSISTATSVPQSSVPSQSTGATSVASEGCEVADEERTYCAFGDDLDDTEEQLSTQMAGRGRQPLVEFTEVPASLQDQAWILKCKDHKEDSPHTIGLEMAHLLHDGQSEVDTEPEGPEAMEAASCLTNQSCINVLEPPAKKAKYVSSMKKRTTWAIPLPQTPAQSMNTTAHLSNPPSAATSVTTSAVSNLAPG